MEKNITNRFLESVSGFCGRELPGRVIDQAKMCLIDYLACANLGESMLRDVNRVYLEGYGYNRGRTSVIGPHVKTTVHAAALLNGLNSHAAELDDGHRYGMIHPGAPVFSALLAASQDRGMDAEHFIRGVVTGYEAAIRLAAAVQPGHKLKGYHATGTCGAIGAALGLAAALGYSFEQQKTVLSAAATDAAGILQVIDDDSELKPYNIGRAAEAAVNAAYIGGTALIGPKDVLGGSRGFFRVTAEDVKEEYLLDGFGDRYAVELIYRKPYAACRHCHAAIEAALKLREECKAEAAEIRSIDVYTYGLAVKGHDHKSISGSSSAKMSIPYSTAAAFLYGAAGYQQFEESCLRDSRLQALTEKVSVYEDPELSRLVPQKRTAIVRVVTGNRTYERRVEYPKGEPENPISEEELESKYFSLMEAAGRNRDEGRNMLGHIWRLETEFQDVLAML